MDYYFGGIGKDRSFGLASETPIVVLDKKEGKFVALQNLNEAKKYEGTSCTIYVWDTKIDNWEEAVFVTLSNRPSPAIGFKADERSKKSN